MIPEKITDEVFNNLKWKSKELNSSSIDKELEGYKILGADTCIAGPKVNKEGEFTDEELIDGVILFLKKPGEKQIKIINIESTEFNFAYLGKDKFSYDLIEMEIAYI